MPEIDAEFYQLPCDSLTDAAITQAMSLGAEWVDIRISEEISRWIQLKDGNLETTSTHSQRGMGIRVICHGVTGFAASSRVDHAVVPELVTKAIAMAKLMRTLPGAAFTLASEPRHTGTWVGNYRLDPITTPESDVVAWLGAGSAMLYQQGVTLTEAEFTAAKERLFYANSDGSRQWQQRVRSQPQFRAIHADEANYVDVVTTVPAAGIGWEIHERPDWERELAILPDFLAEKAAAPSLSAGTYDLVIMPSNLWLTIHESIAHATEFDRILGYEANYAGTSFVRREDIGQLSYGSPLLNVTGDRITPGALATLRWDHEGVAAGRWDIIRQGVLTDVQLDRFSAALAGRERSLGCGYADSALHPVLQRMPNVSMQPDPQGTNLGGLISMVDDGLLVVGDKSWSIDMQRRNFQFTADRFFRIRNGQLHGQVRDIAYQGNTTEFWHSLAAVGGPGTYELHGALNCGKGQPGQVAAVSHGCPAALFRGVNVLATKESR